MFTQPEKEYIKRLLQAQPSLTNDDIKELINKRREKEKLMNTPKQKGILGKIVETWQNIGAWAIQAGWEIAVWLPWQLSRLLPGDQSANKSSFYNKTQRLLESTKQSMAKEGVETEWTWFWFWKWVINIAGGSVLWGWIGKVLSPVAKSKYLSQMWLKVSSALPKTTKYTAPVLKWTLTGGREWLGFDLAQGKAPWSWTIIWAGIGAVSPIAQAGIGLIGKWIKKAWWSLYKTAIRPNTEEARNIIEAKARKTKLPTTVADTALKYWVQGTEKRIWVQGVRKADEIFKKTISPALEKSKATHNIDDVFAKVEKQIAETKSVTRKQELMDGLAAWKEEFATTGKKVFSTSDLQAEKSALDKFTQSKIFKGKEVANGYNQVKNILANVMRQQVRDDLVETGVKNAKELYKDWANLMELEKIGIKWITEGGKRWGSWTAIMTILDKYLTPVKTIWGNQLYRAWKWIEFIWPKWIKTLGSFLRKWWYKLVWDVLTKI